MAILFNSTAELKQFVGVSMALEVETLRPHLENSEAEKQIVKVLGASLYSEIVSGYQSSSLDPAQTLLLPKVQGALAPLAVYYYLQEAAVRISDSGVSSDRENSAFQWQQLKVEQHYLNTAYLRLDNLIAYLLKNKASFEGWEETSEYRASKEFFINTPAEFQQHVNINESYRSLVALRPAMRNVEETFVRPLLLDPLFEELKAAILSGIITDNQAALLRYIRPAVALLTVAQGIEDLQLEITADGSYTSSLKANSGANIKDKSPASDSSLSLMASRMLRRGESWLDALRQYLNDNASATVYPSFFNSKHFEGEVASQPRTQDSLSNTYNAL